MLDNLGIAIAFICLFLGAALLFAPISTPDANQIPTVLSGAALLSLGLITIWLVLKNKWEWRRTYRKYREE
jgi:hypothetical protein